MSFVDFRKRLCMLQCPYHLFFLLSLSNLRFAHTPWLYIFKGLMSPDVFKILYTLNIDIFALLSFRASGPSRHFRVVKYLPTY